MKKYSLSRLRRLLALTAAILLIASLTGCWGGSDDGTEPNTPTGTTPVAADPTDTTPVVTDPPATDAPQASVMGTVTANNLNVRTNTSIDSTVLYQLAINTRVEILEQKTVDGTDWGRIADGWINMHYVLIDGETPVEETEPTTGNDTPAISGDGDTGTITASELYIREGAGSTYDSVGKYKKGDKVTILETKNGWGRTDKGWVSMKYVDLDGSSDTDTSDDDQTTSSEIVSDGKTTVLGHGVVDIGSLNVRCGPGTKYDKVSTVSRASRYAYYEKSGNWVRIKDGWVSTSYFYIEGTKGSGAGTGTVTGSDLNARSGPGTGFDDIGGYDDGDKVEILFQLDTGSGTWGYTSKGWVSMKYVDMGTTSTASTGKATVTASELNIRKAAGTDNDKVGSYKQGDKIEILEVKDGWGRTDKGWVSLQHVTMGTTGKGTVTATSLTIRKGAGTGYEKVGSYENGATVEILEVKNGWGRTDKGWISLDYVKMD